MLFYLTPILYPVDAFQGSADGVTYERLLMVNPLAVIFEQVRVWVLQEATAPTAVEAAGGWLGLLPAAAIFAGDLRVRRLDLQPRRTPNRRGTLSFGCCTVTSPMASKNPSELPIPPRDLLRRIGPMGEEDPVGVYERTGQMHRSLLESVLPDDWSWRGKRVLDFGCGVGRVTRQFAPEADEAEFWGCDLDRPSLDWLEANLSPPFHFFESAEAPDLPQEDNFFDLVFAYSVYTHFTDNWAGWLLEHHRVLREGGLLFATFLGRGMLEPLTGQKWDEDRIGMNPLMHGYSWDRGGPIAINSPWWLRAHWGRLFEIVELLPVIEEGVPSHGVIVARKKPVSLTEEELTGFEPDEPREIEAMRNHVAQLADEVLRLRVAHDVQAAELESLRPKVERYEELLNSRSWRLTEPLRTAKRRLVSR